MNNFQLDSDILRNIEGFIHGDNNTKFEYLNSGKNADVFKYEGFAVKRFFDQAREQNDAIILEELQQSIYYPKLLASGEGFMVTELIDGQTIYQIDGKNGDLIREYEKELKRAKKDARSVGLYSDDVHLNNIMLTQDGQLKIVDVGRFGLAETIPAYEMGFFFSSSSRRHRHKKRHYTSSSHHHHNHSSSSHHHHYTSSSHHHRHHHHRRHRSHSSGFISSFISDIFSS
jgi:hypothetical protein